MANDEDSSDFPSEKVYDDVGIISGYEKCEFPLKWQRRKEMRKRNMMRNLFFSTLNLSSDAAEFKQSVSFVWHQKTSLNRLKAAAAKEGFP